jgi:PASTA domain
MHISRNGTGRDLRYPVGSQLPKALGHGAGVIAFVGAALALAACGGHNRAAPSAHVTTPRAAKVAVPRVAGVHIATAERRLRDAGLVERPYYSGSVGSPRIRTRCYLVLSQGPPPGTRVSKGSQVGIAVGVCPSAMRKNERESAQ